MAFGDGDWQDRLEAIFRKYQAQPEPDMASVREDVTAHLEADQLCTQLAHDAARVDLHVHIHVHGRTVG
jgi:hypothetical protein